MTYILPSIALSGPRGSGKTTIAELIQARYFAKSASFAEPIRRLIAAAYDRRVLDRGQYAAVKAQAYKVRRDVVTLATGLDLMKDIGTVLRKYIDEDIWVKAALGALDPGSVYVLDDLRYPNEADALREAGWVIVQLTAGNECRERRLIARGDPDMSVDHPSEHWWRIVPDFTIDTTNETPEETLDRLLTLVVQRQQIGRYTVAKGGEWRAA
jgi:broad-specificity NMP kinase